MKAREYAIPPFNALAMKGKFLVSNALGAWDFLEKKEFDYLHTLSINHDTRLYKRLYKRGLILEEGNTQKNINDYRNLHSSLFHDTSLHIAVVTTRCNLNCGYCQTKSVNQSDMGQNVAARVIQYLFDVKTPNVTLEFQGGEPLLNWDVIRFLVEHSRRFNKRNKNIQFALTSNLTLLDEEKMEFLSDFNVSLCASFDGPAKVHNANRAFPTGKGTHALVVDKIQKYKKLFGKEVSLLPTITKKSFSYVKEIIDEYIALGQKSIALRPVNQIGNACGGWSTVGYQPEDFVSFYKKALDYIIDCNKRGIYIKERVTSYMLEKILNKRDPGYLELMSPCGAARGQMVYMPDGSCYPCDEARMAGNEIFKIGNILQEDYLDIIKKENVLHLLESSVMDLWAYNSVFLPWMGTCPVVNYYLQGNIVPKIWSSPVHKIYTAQFKYIFEKIMEEDNLKVFKTWISKEVAV